VLVPLASTDWEFDATGILLDTAAPLNPVIGADNVTIEYPYQIYNHIFYADTFTCGHTAGNIAYEVTYDNIEIGNLTFTNDIRPYIEITDIDTNATITRYADDANTYFSLDTTTGIFTINVFTLMGLPTTANLSLKISYYKEIAGPSSESLDIYYGCKYLTEFGYAGNRRIFECGTNKFKDYYCYAENIGYWPNANFTLLGNGGSVIGYGRSNGKLLTFKDGDDSIYVREGVLLDNIEVFPPFEVSELFQIIEPRCIVEHNDSVFVLTKKGLYELQYVNNMVDYQLRSHYIDKNLNSLLTGYYTKAAFIYDDKYYLFIVQGSESAVQTRNTTCYICDMNTVTGDEDVKTPQYEFYPLTEVPFGYRFCLVDYNLYLYSDTVVYAHCLLYGEVFDTYNKVDQIVNSTTLTGTVGYYPIVAYRETPYLDMNNIFKLKTIKNIDIETRSSTGDCVEVGYILPDGTTSILIQSYGTITTTFPNIIAIKETIKSFMNVKLYIKSRVPATPSVAVGTVDLYKNSTFTKILILYRTAGKYRGE
jgi:hypothetical protein